MLFVGVDAHKATSQVTVVSSGGQILKRQRNLHGRSRSSAQQSEGKECSASIRSRDFVLLAKRGIKREAGRQTKRADRVQLRSLYRWRELSAGSGRPENRAPRRCCFGAGL